MSTWHFLKRKFIWVKQDAAQREITRFVRLAFDLLRGKNYVEARGLLLRALQHESKIENPKLLEWILASLWKTWELTEEYQDATKFSSDFLLRNPNYVLALRLRAGSHWYSGKLDEAIGDYTRALEVKPNDVIALSGRGQVLMEYGEFRRALEDLNGALEAIDTVEGTSSNWRARSEAYIRNGRAATYAGLNEFARALEEFEKSIGLCPENAWVYFNRAEAYANHGDQVSAVENYRLALSKKQPKLTLLKRIHVERILDALLG